MIKKANLVPILWIVCAALFAAAAAEAALAPLNPAFEDYIRDSAVSSNGEKMMGLFSYEAAEEDSGYIPSPLNWSHLDGAVYGTVRRQADEVRLRAAKAALPSRFDLRPSMPAVRDQGKFGNCWAHSAMAATESSLIQQGVAQPSDIELSTWYITYYAYNDGDAFVPFTNPKRGTPYYLAGGDDWRAVALLGRGTGSLPEAAAPAPESYDDVYAPEPAPRKYKLSNALYLGNGGSKEVPLSEERRDMIKSAMMEYGAVSAGIYQLRNNSEAQSQLGYDVFSEDGRSYYTGYSQKDENGAAPRANHAITLVGWDDSYPKESFAEDNRPESDGAWIVRNSWGSDWGDEGCYYVSYEEGTLIDGIVYDTAAALSGERVYQYDPLGCVSWFMPYKGNAAGLVSYFANLFTAAGDDRISSVAFYVPSPKNRYEISVYKDCAGSPVSGTVVSYCAADDLVPGYNTVMLTEPADITAGTKFSVVVKVTAPSGGYLYTVPVEDRVSKYSERAEAGSGEGWLSTDGVNFYDITAVDDMESASICLKAFGGRQHTAGYTAVVPGEVTVSGASGLMAQASSVSEKRCMERENDVIEYLCEERVSGIAADKNVSLTGVFEMTAEPADVEGKVSFSVQVSPALTFSGTPYVIIPLNNDSGYKAFPAKYSDAKLSFSVSNIRKYFPKAEITIADVRDSVPPVPPDPPEEGGGGGGCSAGIYTPALMLLIPLVLPQKKRRWKH